MTRNQPLRLAAYIRSSSAQQLDGTGPEVQRDQIQRWAERNGATIVRWCEEVISGTTEGLDREGLSCALSALDDGEADGSNGQDLWMKIL